MVPNPAKSVAETLKDIKSSQVEEEAVQPTNNINNSPIKLMGAHNHVPIDEEDNEDDEEVCVPMNPGKSFLFGKG